jgi:predicted alpha/beta superfamily hydrolase
MGTMQTDEMIIRLALEGETSFPNAVKRIEASEGFPVRTKRNTFIFIYQSSSGSWSLSGDHDDWQGSPMKQMGDWWWIEQTINEPLNSRYKFHNQDDWIADPLARRYHYDKNGEISFVNVSQQHLERWDSLMNDRRIRVWVPENGVFDRILYIHDGQNIYDPTAMWGGWRLQDSLPSRILCVAIDNNAERLNEYTHTSDCINGVEIGGDADEYLERIESEVRPRIAKLYGATEIVGVMGASLGGLLAFYTIHRYPEVYDMAISLSGTMGWGSFSLNNNTMIELFMKSGRRDHYLYLDSGGHGPCIDIDNDGINDDGNDADNYSTNIQFRDALIDMGYEVDVNLWHWYEKNAPHNEAAWAHRVWRSLEKFSVLEKK